MNDGSGIYIILILAFLALTLVGTWKVFEKAGYAGWKCLIPFYSQYCLCEFAMGQGILFLISFIPCAGLFFQIILSVKLAQAFGKGIGMGLLLFFLAPFGYMALGFSDARYIGVQR